MASFKYKTGDSWITLPDEDTTYTLVKNGNTIVLQDSNNNNTSVTDSDTTYSLSKNGSIITLTGSNGSKTSVTDSDTKFNILSCYPIGAIYMSYNGTSPATIIGGAWAQITDRFLFCSNSANNYGGEWNHTLSINEMPSHGHPNSVPGYASLAVNGQGSIPYGSVLAGDWHYTPNTGGGRAHNNMPPYVTVFCWRRTA